MARILVIDDDEDIIDNLSMVLSSDGHTVLTKEDTENLISDVTAAAPDLIIMDIMFPEDPRAGFKAVRQLSEVEALRHIPILVLSAVGMKADLGFRVDDELGGLLPDGAFLDKPIEPKKLLGKVRERLEA